MKTYFLICGLFCAAMIHAQTGDELLVYSLKGNVTVIENNTEIRAKIGTILKPGSVVKTQKLAKLTMVCKQGKPISVTREGVFPVETWKDSCLVNSNSITTKYFQYIWDQLYVRNDELKSETAMMDAPMRGEEELEIRVNKLLDTVNYASGSFPLSWVTNRPYRGKYYFKLSNLKTGKLLHIAHISSEKMQLDFLKKWMQPGNLYRWQVSLAKTGEGEGGVIRVKTAAQVIKFINTIKNMVNVHEDQATQYFRFAYFLRESQYIADAYQYLKKAAQLAPGVQLYQETLSEFKKEFNIF